MPRPSVLLVDDDRDSRLIYGAILRRAGYHVRTAETGEDAIRLAFEGGPDLVVLDLLLPTVDGWTVARVLKEDPRTVDIPLLAVTAHPGEAERERARAAGCMAVLLKPCSPFVLLRQVQEALASRKGAAAFAESEPVVVPLRSRPEFPPALEA